MILLLLALACTPQAPQAPQPHTPEVPAATPPPTRTDQTRVVLPWGGGDAVEVGQDSPWTTSVSAPTELRMTVASADKPTTARVKLGDVTLETLQVGTKPTHVRVALPESGELTVESEGVVHLFDPVMSSPRVDPRRVVLVFMDTTRADHLQPYGYERETTPTLARFAKEAAVFEQARSVAPWTLPSVRATLTGRQPEHWADTPALPELLAQQGFATRASFTNTYLTPAFGMDRGWQAYHYGLKRPASEVVDDALGWLEHLEGRDSLLLLQFMDAHLPYREPKRYRGRWAEKDWAGPELSFPVLRKLKPKGAELERLQTHMRGRYDQNLRFIDDQLERLFAALSPKDIVIVFSDHGEEFWEHGGFEHGHAFWDEVLHVPLLIRAPGLDAGRVETSVSLLDITPTVLDLLGLPLPEALDGGSLRSPAPDRALVFGRPLYGHDGWGVTHKGRKWWGRAGEQAAFDLTADPGESTPLDPTATTAVRDAFAEGWKAPLHRGWVVTLNSGPLKGDNLNVEISHPDGIARAWPVYAPRAKAALAQPTVDNGVLRYTQGPADGSAGSLFILPAGDVSNPTGLSVSMTLGDRSFDETFDQALPPEAFERRKMLFELGEKGFKALVRAGWQPEPTGTAVSAFDPDRAEELRALGYLE